MDGRGSSGTPFTQINDYCRKNNHKFKYSCYGIQENSNHGGLFEIARKLEVNYVRAEEFAVLAKKVETRQKRT